MSFTLYIPCDSEAVSVGADDVADAFAHALEKRGLRVFTLWSD